MNTALYTALVSMNAVQSRLDVIAKNVANYNTTGYKKREASFEDLLTSVVRQNREYQLPGRATPPGFVLGNGSRVHEIQLHLDQGPIKDTGNKLDFSIEGEGFFEVEVPEDRLLNSEGVLESRGAYTRDGSFQFSRNPDNPNFNFLVSKTGRFIRDVNNERIQIPANGKMQVDDSGNISVQLNNGDILDNVAKIKIVRVIQPRLLENIGDNLYVMPRFAGIDNPTYVNTINLNDDVTTPVQVRQGYLEESNVNLADEMAELVNTQRNFQLLSRSIGMTDTMMGLANSLRA